MNHKTKVIVILSTVIALGLLICVGLVFAQTDGENDDNNQPNSVDAVAALIDDVVQVQGRLTDAGGAPINGNVNVTAAIYDVSVGGVARCSDIDTVIVSNGLFTMAMDFCTASVFNGDQLWLGIQVGADPEMTPRQAIYAVPYAWSLRPGSIVKGADSYVFIPGNTLVKNLSSDTTRWDIQANGAARIWRGASAGTKVIYLPVILPAVLYGQNITIEEIRVYYRCQNGANSYIDETDLLVQTDADSWLTIVQDPTNRASNTASSYTLSVSANNVLSLDQGALGLFFYIHFNNDTDYLQLGGVRLRLGHQ
jgi:hypothetical protein